MFDYAAYAQRLREEIHMYPEIGYDLTKTLAVVHRELDAMGIAHTEKWAEAPALVTLAKKMHPSPSACVPIWMRYP